MTLQKLREIHRKRRVTIFVLIFVILVATPFGMAFTLQRAADKVSNGFYNGVYLADEGYTVPSVNSYFNDIRHNALGLAVIGAKYNSVSLKVNSVKIYNDKLLKAETVSEKNTANTNLVNSVNILINALQNQELSELDFSNLQEYSQNFTSAEGALKNSAEYYNQSVDNFYSATLSKFPAKLIAKIFPIKTPEKFGI